MALAFHTAAQRQTPSRAPGQHGQTRLRVGAERQFYARRQMDCVPQQFQRQFPGLCRRSRKISRMDELSRSMVVPILALMAAGTFAVDPRAAPTPKRFVISDYGAVGDGKTLNTKTIQAAIDRCA